MQQPKDKDNLNPYPHQAEQAGRTGDGGAQQKSAEGPKGYASAKENTPDFNPGIEMPQTPQMELPKGGGAIQGIGEKFEANPVTGTASFQVPIALSPGRNGLAHNWHFPTIPVGATVPLVWGGISVSPTSYGKPAAGCLLTAMRKKRTSLCFRGRKTSCRF